MRCYRRCSLWPLGVQSGALPPVGFAALPRDAFTRKKDILSQIVGAVQAGTPMTVQEEGLCPSVRAFSFARASCLLSGKSIPGVNWPKAKRGLAP